MAGVNGSTERAVLQNLLSYLASEVHPSIGGLFNPTIGEEVKEYLRGNAAKKLSYLENNILNGEGKKFLVGESFSIADSYLYIIQNLDEVRWY
ncbi:MAG: glutathione S-transferase family protein [Bacteroidetes bacterium]|nr:glutathione S-transferase family protein [Bacteroidota bacterium]